MPIVQPKMEITDDQFRKIEAAFGRLNTPHFNNRRKAMKRRRNCKIAAYLAACATIGFAIGASKPTK